MGALFGKPRPHPKASPAPRPAPSLSPAEAAQLELKRTRDRVTKFEARANGDAAALTERAREALAAGNKTAALRCVSGELRRGGRLGRGSWAAHGVALRGCGGAAVHRVLSRRACCWGQPCTASRETQPTPPPERGSGGIPCLSTHREARYHTLELRDPAGRRSRHEAHTCTPSPGDGALPSARPFLPCSMLKLKKLKLAQAETAHGQLVNLEAMVRVVLWLWQWCELGAMSSCCAGARPDCGTIRRTGCAALGRRSWWQR
jgi:hypothetical protein